MFMPGPLELLILGFLCVVALAVPVAILIFVLRKRPPSNPNQQ